MYGLYQYCIGEPYEREKISLVKDEKMVSIEKNCFFIWNPCDTGFCEKKLMQAVEKHIIQAVMEDEEKYTEFLKYCKTNTNMIQQILCDLTVPMETTHEIGLADWIKLLSIRLIGMSENIFEKLEQIVTISGFIGEENILIIPHLKKYITKEELVEIYKCALYNDTNLLILEDDSDESNLDYESVTYIDTDYEEFLF